MIWNAAYELADLGFSIIPLKGKKPAVPWEKYQKEPATREQLEKWEDEFPHDNIGLVTGKVSGVIVVDVDSKEGIDFCKENGIISPIYQKTGKGFHLFFKAPDQPIQNKVRFGPGVDLRAEGGQVVIAPSVHFDTGKKYELIISKGATWDDLPELDEKWLIPQIQNAQIDLSSVKTYGLDLAKKSAGEGRNNTLAKNAGYLANKNVQPDEIIELLWSLNLQTNVPPLGRNELERTVLSICKKHAKANPHYLENTQTDDQIWQSLFTFDAWSCENFIDEDPPKINFLVDDLIVKESCAGLLVAAGGTGKGFFCLDLAFSLATGQKFFDRATNGRFSTLILNAEDSRIEQHRRLRKIISKKFEDDQIEDFKEVKKALKHIFIPEFSELSEMHLFPEQETKTEEFLYKWVEHERREGREPGLVILDPANKLIMDDLNDSRVASKLMHILNRFSKKTGVESLLVTHTNKESQRSSITDPTAVLGSVSFANSARYIITLVPFSEKDAKEFGLTKNERHNHIICTLAKSNYAAFDQFYLKKDSKMDSQPGVFSLLKLDQNAMTESEQIGFSQVELLEELREFEKDENGHINRRNFINQMYANGIPRQTTETMLSGLIFSGEISISKGKNNKKIITINQ